MGKAVIALYASYFLTFYPDPSEINNTISLATQYVQEETQSGQVAERPISIEFICSRRYREQHHTIQSLFEHYVANQASCFLKPKGWESNCRGALKECGCSTLSRTCNCKIRQAYEDAVITKVLNLVALQPDNFHIKIAIFGSGGLHGEIVLLFRLIHALNVMERAGRISLFLMDEQYDPFIQKTNRFHANSFHGGNRMNGLLGYRADFKQFLTEISFILPPSIIVDGNIFGHHSDYIKAAINDPYYRHHLLIGADIGNTEDIIRQIGMEAAEGNEPAIVLIKEQQVQPEYEVPKVCVVPHGLEMPSVPLVIFEKTNINSKKECLVDYY